ncbi:hypothetical protein AUN02_21875 [Cronobacter sakazakii]|uniref:hypothetical protein n=1 Tax=Cronobacter sakazakii TaxID=28141 RepID=UPI000B4AD872|nr:hypothetical protein [Cronobacter sakazakii]EKK3978376.1 hypothetical protein [Cronobacter sakazakii]EKK5170932.1 hypothetical protein [Cronobacter sakazakii]EKY2044643.1 hypothetical protein [Cronobacter sakazakii]EKY2084328.1 hypothetical protein [Cronobacter sakazakii]ELY3609977.1 hypothetical protein [Cronobacter sakazakii]
MLNDFNLLEVTTLETSFKQKGHSRGQGNVDFIFGSLNIEAGAELATDSSKSVLIVLAEPQAVGFREENNEEEFSLSMKMKMVYTYPSSFTVDEKFITESSWFFSSFLRTYFKFYAEEILRQAGIDGIKLPLN